MNPSGKYVFENTTLGGVKCKTTTQTYGELYPLYASLDKSIAYTLPQNTNYRTMTNMLIVNDFPQRAYDDEDYFQQSYHNNAGGTGSLIYRCLGEVIGNNSGDASVVMYWTFATGDGRYAFNGDQGNAIIKTSNAENTKFISGFDISHVIFEATIKGYTTASYNQWKSTGDSPTAIDITLHDLIDNPDDYVVYRFGINSVAGWSEADEEWKTNPGINLTCLIDGGAGIQEIERPQYVFGYQMGISTDYTGGINVDTYHLWKDAQHYSISDSTKYLRKGGIPYGLVANNSYGLGHAPSEWKLQPKWTVEECQAAIDQSMSEVTNQTLTPNAVYSSDFVEMWGYDTYTIKANWTGAPQGQFHFQKYDKKLSYVTPGSAICEFLASAGCYFWTGTHNANLYNYLNTNEITPDTLSEEEDIGLGVMADDGTTTGQWILGEDIEDYEGPNKKGDIVHPDFNPTPGGNPGDKGEWDDMPGAGSSIGALAGARCYVCSKTDIANLKNWMSKTEAQGGPPDGYDVLSSLISVMAFPVDMTKASSGPKSTITFTGLKTSTDNALMNIATALMCLSNQVGATPSTETKMFTSTASAYPSAGNPFTINLGSVTCPEFYTNSYPFADYDASVELYLPFIGTMSLDTQTVMGKSLQAYMSVDPITGAIYAWCECTNGSSRVIVASGAGAFGVNTPITANQVGMAMAQIKNNAAQARNSFIQSAATMAVGAITGVDKNMTSVLTNRIMSGNKNIAIAAGRDYMDALSVGAGQASVMAIPNAIGASLNNGRANRQIAQANHNNVSGSAGGSTADWACSYTPYLKIITPDVHEAGDQYEHTHGVPTYQTGTLSSFSGLTFCANPDVSSISTATDQEKQQIFGLLTGGVYV